jgi:hypothetical protein
MTAEQHNDVTIDDFHPRRDGFVQSYKGEWREQGMVATAWLDLVERDHFPRGLYLKDAYELSSTYERTAGGKARGTQQEEQGAELAHKLRERMKSAMREAGWQVVAHTKEGKDIWQYKPERVAPAKQSAPAENVTSTQVVVTRRARNVIFTCEVCGTHTSQLRMPGPKPRYCSDTCKDEAQRMKSRARVANFRDRLKKEREVS